MKIFLTAFLVLVAGLAHAANPGFNDFNTNQFGTAGNKVSIKSGVRETNLNVLTTLSLNGITINDWSDLSSPTSGITATIATQISYTISGIVATNIGNNSGVGTNTTLRGTTTNLNSSGSLFSKWFTGEAARPWNSFGLSQQDYANASYARSNNVWRFGYNMAPSGSPLNSADLSAGIVTESFYQGQLEYYFSVFGTNGVERRPFGFVVNNSTNDPDYLKVTTVTVNGPFIVNDQAGATVAFGADTNLVSSYVPTRVLNGSYLGLLDEANFHYLRLFSTTNLPETGLAAIELLSSGPPVLFRGASYYDFSTNIFAYGATNRFSGAVGFGSTLTLGSGKIDTWDDVTNFFAMPSGSGGGTVSNSAALTSGAITVGGGNGTITPTGVFIDTSSNLTGVATLTVNELDVNNAFLTNILGDVTFAGTVTLTNPIIYDGFRMFNETAGYTSGSLLIMKSTDGAIRSSLNGTAITNLNASNISSGTVPTARLGSGTANNTTFLRGDQNWVTISAGGGDAYLTNRLGDFASTTSQYFGSAISDETGSTSPGVVVFNNGPTFLDQFFIRDTELSENYQIISDESKLFINPPSPYSTTNSWVFDHVNGHFSTPILDVQLAGYGNFSGATNLHLNVQTATFSGPTNVLTIAQDSSYDTSANVGLTGLGGVIAGQAQFGTLAIFNSSGSDKTLTLPSNWLTPDGLRSYTLTNAILTQITVRKSASYTNASVTHFY